MVLASASSRSTKQRDIEIKPSPRIGIAYDPFGDGKTSIRAGFGITYDPLPFGRLHANCDGGRCDGCYGSGLRPSGGDSCDSRGRRSPSPALAGCRIVASPDVPAALLGGVLLAAIVAFAADRYPVTDEIP